MKPFSMSIGIGGSQLSGCLQEEDSAKLFMEKARPESMINCKDLGASAWGDRSILHLPVSLMRCLFRLTHLQHSILTEL